MHRRILHNGSEVRSSNRHMKRGPSSRDRRRSKSRSPRSSRSDEYHTSRDQLTERQRNILELEEKIKRLDRSMEASSSKLDSNYTFRRSSRSRSRSRSRDRLNRGSSYPFEPKFVEPMAVPQPNFDMNYIPVYPTFSDFGQQPVSMNERLSFPSLWNDHGDIMVDPVPVYPTDSSPEGNGQFFENDSRERISIEVRVPPVDVPIRNTSVFEDDARRREEEMMVAKQAEEIKRRHFEKVERNKKEEMEKERRRRKREDEKNFDIRKAEREKRHIEAKKKEEESRNERDRRNNIAKKENDVTRRRIESERKSTDGVRKPEPSRRKETETSSSSKPSLAAERAMAFLKELKISLGPLVYKSTCEKKDNKEVWTTVCHITNIPKELISATSIGKSTKESSQYHSVERFLEKWVYFGLLTKALKDGFSNYKALPVFLAGIMDSYCNDVAIYGTQISVTEDTDMVKKFTIFVKLKSEEFWESKQPIVDAFLKCQSVDSSNSGTKDADDRRRREDKEKERRREKEREREKERDREKERRREREDRSKHRRRSRSRSPLNTEKFTQIAQSLLSQQYAQMIQPPLNYVNPQPGPPGIPPVINYLPNNGPPVQNSYMPSMMPNQPMGPMPMQQPMNSFQQPGYNMPNMNMNNGFPMNEYQPPNNINMPSVPSKPQSLMGPPVQLNLPGYAPQQQPQQQQQQPQQQSKQPVRNLVDVLRQTNSVKKPQNGQELSKSAKKRNRKKNGSVKDEVDLFDEVFK